MSISDEWQTYAKNKANEILEEAKDSYPLRAPIPIKEIIESYVVDVSYDIRMDYNFPAGISAFSQKDMEVGWIIVVNGLDTVERQRFSSAHELAHIVLFKNQESTVFCSQDSHSWNEKLCNQFAGHILMPEKLVREIYQSTPSPYLEDIATKFKVSKPVAEIQLRHLGLLVIKKEARF